MKYCSQCGAPVSMEIPNGDNLPRHVCTQCRTIHYQNPKIVAGCIVEWQEKVLLCRRAIEPRHGTWTLPAGFMENGETTLEAAIRETREEACAPVDQLKLYALFNLPHIDQVYIMFRGLSESGQAAAGTESLEVGFFHEGEIPWDEIAFPVIHETLQMYFEDRNKSHFPTRTRFGDVTRRADHTIEIKRHD